MSIYIGILASREETSLIDLILKFMGYFAGGILGMFLLGILCVRANGTGAFLGALLSTGFVLTMSKSPPFYIPELHSYLGIGPIPFIWFTAVSLPMTMILGYLFSLAGAKPPPEKLEDLTCKW